MNFKTKAVVLKKIDYVENQKYLDILTPKNGILNVKFKIFGQVTKNVFSNVCVAGFYEFSLFSGRFGIVVDSVEEIEQFFKLRFQPEKLALAQYFCEISYLLSLPIKKASRQLRLLLNAIWFLEKKDCLLCDFVKAVFEVRLISYSGYMPNLVCCKFCCCYEKQGMFFGASHGFLICEDCLKKHRDFKNLIKLTKPVLYAMRFIIYKDDADIFKFSLEKKHLDLFCKIAQDLILLFVERQPKTLEIYKEFKEEHNLNGTF